MSKFEIKKLSDREHIIKRPSMYIGSVSNEESQETVFSNNVATAKTLTYPPGLIKIINEVIDNSVDVILKTKVGDEVRVIMEAEGVSVIDNSAGFPSPKDGEEPPVVTALGNARAGSNFNDEDNIGQIGTNGVGAFATNCFSTEFFAKTMNEKHVMLAKWKNNAEFNGFEILPNGSKQTGTTVSFLPDFAKFGIDKITEDMKEVIYSRLVMLALTYPNIKFKFNGVLIKTKSIEKFFATEETAHVSFKAKNYEVLVIARNEKTPNFSFVNGLNTKDGGTHIDVIVNDISKALMETKGLNCTKTDINNTLQIVFLGSGWRNLRFNSQTKEKITNSVKEARDYLGNLEDLVTKVKKSKAIKDFIKATTQARELRADKKALKDAKKTKIKSDKFLDAQGSREMLMLVEGDSAMGGLVPALGRKGIAYYALKGKPLNAWKSTSQKVAANKELSELLAIIHQNDFKKIVISTDQDLDGFHIRGLLLGFIFKFLPEYKDKVYFLQTPVRGVMKNGKLVRWSYNLTDNLAIKSGEISQYYKGLGTWDPEDFREVLKKDGIDNITQHVAFDRSDDAMDAWLGDDSDKRKGMILDNDFSITRI